MNMPTTNYPNRSFWSIIATAVACGLAAGILGAMVTRVYLLDGPYSPWGREFEFPDLTGSPALVIRDAKMVVVNQDVKIGETLAGLRPSLMSIHREVASTTTAFYPLDEPIFIGLVITADGWVVGLAPADWEEEGLEDYVAIGADRRRYKIAERATLPGLSDEFIIFRLAEAANLPVKKIVPRSELSLGQSLLALSGPDTARPVSLVSLRQAASVLTSDRPNARLALDGLSGNIRSFIFDLSGGLVALGTAEGEIVPAFAYAPLWQQLSQAESASRPYLGVNYLDLSRNLVPHLRLDRGAWLYSLAGRPAVQPGSPAARAGLQAGDVISWVNNQEIGPASDLADIIATYQAGQEITLAYRRDGQERTATLTLGQAE